MDDVFGEITGSVERDLEEKQDRKLSAWAIWIFVAIAAIFGAVGLVAYSDTGPTDQKVTGAPEKEKTFTVSLELPEGACGGIPDIFRAREKFEFEHPTLAVKGMTAPRDCARTVTIYTEETAFPAFSHPLPGRE